jgi:antitoxin (DNA-binding transcriptional repressor) of toxin-antitoxin stability system
MSPMRVVIRSFDLSGYITSVRDGEQIVLTDYGRAVARLVAIDGDESLDRLIARGAITPAAAQPGTLRRARPRPMVSDLVAAWRR